MTMDKVRAQYRQPVLFEPRISGMIVNETRHDRNATTEPGKAEIVRMKSGLLLTVATTAMLLAGGHAAKAAWAFTTLTDPLGTEGTVATSISKSGEIVGYYVDSSGNSNGFSYNGSNYTTVDVAGAAMTVATGVNSSGTITGYYTDTSGGVHGFTQTGTTSTFDDPSAKTGGATYGSATTTTGTTVGYYFDSGLAAHGFTDVGGTFTALNVTGVAGTPSQTKALGINGNGTIVGSYYNGTATDGFLDNSGSFTSFSAPGATSTVITSIDGVGDFAGYYVDGGGITNGFVDISGTFYTVDDPNAGSTTEILGFNSVGQVVGYYVDPNGVISGFTADVPEPATLALFGLAVFGAGALRRRRALSA